MQQASTSRNRFRFRGFELDIPAYQLRYQGHRLKLGKQPMDLLILLVENCGQLVSRAQIIDRLWGKDVFVDVDTGINTAISKIRQALRDSPDSPTFVETVPGKGYRFIADVEAVPTSSLDAPQMPDTGSRENGIPSPVALPDETEPSISRLPRRATYIRLAIGLAALAMATGFIAWKWVSASRQASRTTIAVLPFKNLDSNPERQYLADGFTDETASSLAQIDPEGLSVKGRTLRYRDTTKSAAEIGQELSVDYLVESSIQAEGTRVRVTATLIRVRDQEHVWSRSYERQPSSLLALQQEVSAAIAEQVRLKLTSDQRSELGRRQTQNADAYDAYLKGRYLEQARTPTANAQAIQQYEHAIALDPDYALAWVSLALTYAGSTINSDTPPLVMGPRSRDAAAHAVRANPHLAETQFVLGYINWMIDWNWKAAEDSFRQAIALDPSNAVAYRVLGHSLSQMGRHQEAESAMRRARDLDPLEAITHALSAQVSFQARDSTAAIAHARQAIALNPELWIGYVQLGQAYEQANRNDLALEVLADATRLSGGNSKALSLRGYLLGKTGQIREAKEVLRTLVSRSRERYVPPFAMALVYAGMGDREQVFEWLDKAYAARDVHLIYLTVDSKWDPYRTDPRFQKLLDQCGFIRPSS